MTVQENLIRVSLASGITVALLIGVASAAMARQVTVVGEKIDPNVATERVSFSDLNLASKADVSLLKRRIGGAVHRVCLQTNPATTYGGCKYDTWHEVRPQIALAVNRAQQMAATGTSTIAPVAIVISAH